MRAAFKKIKKFFVLFFNTTPCKECLRGRLAFVSAFSSFLCFFIPEVFVFFVSALACFVFVGRKNDWWIDA